MEKFNMKSPDFIKRIEKQPVLLKRFEQLLCIVEDYNPPTNSDKKSKHSYSKLVTICKKLEP